MELRELRELVGDSRVSSGETGIQSYFKTWKFTRCVCLGFTHSNTHCSGSSLLHRTETCCPLISIHWCVCSLESLDCAWSFCISKVTCNIPGSTYHFSADLVSRVPSHQITPSHPTHHQLAIFFLRCRWVFFMQEICSRNPDTSSVKMMEVWAILVYHRADSY